MPISNLKDGTASPGDFSVFLFRQKLFFLFQLNYSTSSEEMVSDDDYEIWILPQELQSVDINLQSFWSNWCSAEEECNFLLRRTLYPVFHSQWSCVSFPHCKAVWVWSCDPGLWIFWDSIHGDFEKLWMSAKKECIIAQWMRSSLLGKNCDVSPACTKLTGQTIVNSSI